MIVRELSDIEEGLVEQIVALEKEAFGVGGMNHWFLVPFIRHGRVFVALIGDEVVGVCEYMLDFRRPSQAYLFGFVVKEEWRNSGVGKRLLHKTCTVLKAHGISAVSLTVHPDNMGARRLYEKFGFTITEYRTDEYGAGEHRLEYVLDLNSWKETML